ncbi:glycosyltransferase [Kaistella sp. DKR-2]|uniref:glycosyltransferase n=1 Tax=Kaistella soli TaxID=2849654 RepID=UPI001C26F66B|nr:glycosyltransferase [Kaistella soli]MBU8883088.1 glycosyltransferase [Kaistella soli]
MILLDSLYINNSGGKVLLDYLVQEVEKAGLEVFYLFDERCKKDFGDIPSSRKIYLKASLLKRHQFYKAHQTRFSTVLCFGNLAPSLKLKVPVYTYFHQRLFIEQSTNLSPKEKVIFRIKSLIFKWLAGNTDKMVVQTESVKRSLHRALPLLDQQNIIVVPFYRSLSYPEVEKDPKSFIYVSGGSIYKNHDLLLEAFTKFYDDCQTGKLVLTISKDSPILAEKIMKFQNMGYPIVNLGFINHSELGLHYAKAEFSVYPSKSESFGLGILEAIEADCKIIGSDMDYLHAVCKPSLTFDPDEISSIQQGFKQAVTENIKETEQIVYNQIEYLIQILKQSNNENQ